MRLRRLMDPCTGANAKTRVNFLKSLQVDLYKHLTMQASGTIVR